MKNLIVFIGLLLLLSNNGQAKDKLTLSEIGSINLANDSTLELTSKDEKKRLYLNQRNWSFKPDFEHVYSKRRDTLFFNQAALFLPRNKGEIFCNKIGTFLNKDNAYDDGINCNPLLDMQKVDKYQLESITEANALVSWITKSKRLEPKIEQSFLIDSQTTQTPFDTCIISVHYGYGTLKNILKKPIFRIKTKYGLLTLEPYKQDYCLYYTFIIKNNDKDDKETKRQEYITGPKWLNYIISDAIYGQAKIAACHMDSAKQLK